MPIGVQKAMIAPVNNKQVCKQSTKQRGNILFLVDISCHL